MGSWSWAQHTNERLIHIDAENKRLRELLREVHEKAEETIAFDKGSDGDRSALHNIEHKTREFNQYALANTPMDI